MRKDPLKEEALRKVSDLRSEGVSDEASATLRSVIKKREGVVVAKAAELAAEWNATELAQDLHDAFYRLSEDGLESDPQCWGKIAIVKQGWIAGIPVHALHIAGIDLESEPVIESFSGIDCILTCHGINYK